MTRRLTAKEKRLKPKDRGVKGKGGNPNPNKGGLTKFKKGERRVGRVKGVKNKLGVRVKECILAAAELSGSDGKGKGGATGYLVWLSRSEPAVFGRMLEKIMPTQVEVKDNTNRAMTPDEAVARLQERGLPVPPDLLELSSQVGRAVAQRRVEDDNEELNNDAFDEPTGDEEHEHAEEDTQ
jgi:hypothetical protein